MRFSTPFVFFLLLGTTLRVLAASPSRVYAGGFTTKWITRGIHGHNQPHCSFASNPPVDLTMCDETDFCHGNLDNSIGYRTGWERDFLNIRSLHIVGGAEASISLTEYNRSQHGVALFYGAVTTGADLDVLGGRIGFRVGGGPFALTDNQQTPHLHAFREGTLTLPLQSGASVRLSARRVTSYTTPYGTEDAQRNQLTIRSVRTTEISVLLSASQGVSDSPWEFGTTTGTTKPGRGTGAGLGLRLAPYHQLTFARELGRSRTQAYFGWITSAHESARSSVFMGYDRNYRSKTINSFGLGARREMLLGETWSIPYGGGFEVADWRDDHELLVRSSGTPVVAGIETALVVNGALRYRLRGGTALEINGQQLYWTGIRLAEQRWGIGLVLTR